MAIAPRDENYVPGLVAASSVDGTTPVTLYADPTSHELLVSADVTVEGANGAILDFDNSAIGANVLNLANNNPLTVAIVDGDGDQLVSFGGGTQYATGTAEATPTGTVALGWDGSDVIALTTDASGHLQVDVLSGGGGGTQYQVGDVAGATDTGTLSLVIRDDALTTLSDADGDYVGLRVGSTGALWTTFTNTTLAVTNAGTFAVQAAQSGSWTVTANAGTNLNTSALLTSADFAAAFGTAGSADSQVMSIQGIASMTPVIVADGGSAITVDGTVTIQGDVGTVDQFDLTNSNPLSVAIVNGDGDQITSFGGGTQYDTNVAYQDGDTGTIALTIRDDALTTLTEADGDFSGLRVSSVGALWTTFTNTTIAVTNAGTFAVQVDSSSLPTGAATLAEQQTQTALLTTIDSDTGTIATNTADLLTNTTFNAAFGTAGSADAQVLSIQGIASMTPIQISDGGNVITVDGTVAVTQSTSPWVTTAVGTVADDSPTPGAPITVGGLAKSPDGTDPTSVAENDVARFATDLNRRIYVNTTHPQHWNFHSNGSSALTDQSVAADPGDGFQLVVTSIIFSTGAATACNVFFEEGSTTVLGPWYLEAVAGRGVHWTGEKFITASTALTVTTSAAIAQSLDVCGYIQAV